MRASRKQLAMLRSLRTRKGRRETALFLVEGLRLCSELVRARVSAELVLLSTEVAKQRRVAELVKSLRLAGARVLEAPARELQRVSDTVHCQGILAAARWPDIPFEGRSFGRTAIVLALDRVSDPGNVGTTIRTAAWFGASVVLLSRGCADLLNPKTVRATMGGLFHLPVCRDVPLPAALDRLRRLGFVITVAAMDGSPDWRSWADRARSALVLGSEAHGVEPDVRARADKILAIPKRGAGESLNVAVSAGIFLSCAE